MYPDFAYFKQNNEIVMNRASIHHFFFLLFFLLPLTLASQEIPVWEGKVIVKLTPAGAACDAFANDALLREIAASVGVVNLRSMLSPSVETQAHAMAGAKAAEVTFWENEVRRIFIVSYSSDESPWLVAKRLAANPNVEYAEPLMLQKPLGDQITPNDSLFSQQTFLKTIMAEAAWDVTEGSENTVIAVADTDIKWDHPDLEANIWNNPGEVGTDAQGKDKRTNGMDDDGDGKVDDWHGWDFAGADNVTPDNDTRSTTGGHGTSVSGLVAAVTNNGIGISSIGNKCKILPIKIGADGGANLAYGYDAIEYASARGAKVFNASWGGFGYSQAAEDIINLATSRGMIIIGGGGNHGGTTPFYPAAYRNVLDVGVTDANDNIQGLSGYGPSVDVMSPGQGALTINLSDGYSGFGATSAAAPITSGLAGLVVTKFPSFSAEQIRERIRVTADNIDAKNPAKVKFAGKGRINAFRAVADPPTPSLRIVSSEFHDPNNDKRLDAGEEIAVVVNLKNYLSTTQGDVTLTLVPVQNAASVHVTNASLTIPMVGDGATVNNSATPFSFTVLPAPTFDAIVLFRVDISSGTYEDFDFISVAVNPSYKDIASNQLSMTVQANGMFGFKDYPDNTLGNGMHFSTTDAQLFLSSVMFGTDENHIVDNARGRGSQDFLARQNDFQIIEPVSILEPYGGARAAAISRFTDAEADSARRLFIDVKHEVFDFSNQGIRDVLVSRFTVTNTGTAPLIGLR